jgi:Beta-propeller repeat
VGASGNAYVTGTTTSSDFPTTPGAFQTTPGDGFGRIQDAFVSKLNAAGSALVYSTYLGATDTAGFGIAVDAKGNAFVAGFTNSANFPTTPGAFQTTYGGLGDAFVTKLNAAGSGLLYSTYLGGGGDDLATAIEVDAAGNSFVTGHTSSTDFPTTRGAFQTICGGCNGATNSGDAFITKLDPDGSALLYSTFLGGSGDETGNSVAVDATANAYVTGSTSSTDFPTTRNAFQAAYGGGISDAFVSKLNAAGSVLVYSTYMGGNDIDNGTGMRFGASEPNGTTEAKSATRPPSGRRRMTIGSTTKLPRATHTSQATAFLPTSPLPRALFRLSLGEWQMPLWRRSLRLLLPEGLERRTVTARASLH